MTNFYNKIMIDCTNGVIGLYDDFVAKTYVEPKDMSYDKTSAPYILANLDGMTDGMIALDGNGTYIGKTMIKSNGCARAH